MCKLCNVTPQEERDERDRLKSIASDLEALANKFNSLANGNMKPHSEKAKEIGINAKYVVKDLVEWI